MQDGWVMDGGGDGGWVGDGWWWRIKRRAMCGCVREGERGRGWKWSKLCGVSVGVGDDRGA